jgi:DNA-binding transcriptional regulator YhcF (GntR family)
VAVQVGLVLNPDEPALSQIVDYVTRMVALALYKPGDALPPSIELADQLGVSKGIVQQAYALLEERHVTEPVRGEATYISHTADTRRTYAQRLFSDVLAQIRSIHPPLKREEIRAAYLDEEERHFRQRRTKREKPE